MINENTPLMDYVKDLEKENERLLKRCLALETAGVPQQPRNQFYLCEGLYFETLSEAARFAVSQTRGTPITVFSVKEEGRTVVKSVDFKRRGK